MTTSASPAPRRSPRFSLQIPSPISLADKGTNRRLQFENAGSILAPSSVDAGPNTSSDNGMVTAPSQPIISYVRDMPLRVSGASSPLSPCGVRRVRLHQYQEPVTVPSFIEGVPTSSEGDLPDRLNTEEMTPPSSPRHDRGNLSPRHTGVGGRSPIGAILVDAEADPGGHIRAARAEKMSAAFSFLSQHLKTRQLKKVLKEWRWKQSGNKSTLAARAFLHLQINILSGKTVQEVLMGHAETQKFESWFEHRVTLDNRSPLYLTCAPDESELLSLLKVKEVESFKRQRLTLLRAKEGLPPVNGQGNGFNARNTGDEVVCNTGASQQPVLETHMFSISEFARLCITMRDDEDAKCALAGIGQELTRSQIDAGFTRDSYWGVIESHFNDPGLRLNLNMTGHVDDVNSALPPPCHRSASFLKDKFLEAKRSYTAKLSNWSQSGQNDNADFKRFAGSRNGELIAEGKRNMVIFVCARMGTDNEDTRFSNMCSRAIPSGRGCDEGGTEESQQGASEMVGRSRRKSKNDSESAFERSWMKYSEVATAEKRAKVAERLEKAEKGKRMCIQNARKEFLEGRQWAVISMGNLQQTMKSSGVVPDTTFEECARMQMEDLRKAFMIPQPEAMGLLAKTPQSDEGPASNNPSGPDERHNRQPERQRATRGIEEKKMRYNLHSDVHCSSRQEQCPGMHVRPLKTSPVTRKKRVASQTVKG